MVPANETESIASYERIPEYIQKRIYYVKLPGTLLGTSPAGEVKRENLKPVIEAMRK